MTRLSGSTIPRTGLRCPRAAARFLTWALVAALTLPAPAAALATTDLPAGPPALDGAVSYQGEGDPFSLTYDTQGTPAPGDDDAHVAKTLSSAEVDLSGLTAWLPFGAPVPEGMPSSSGVDFREAEVQHPLVQALDLVDESVADPLGLPAGVDIHEQGISPHLDPPVDLAPAWRGPTSGTIHWPEDGYGLLPVGAGYHGLGFTDHVASSSDDLLRSLDRHMANHCGLPSCPPGVADHAMPLLPEVVWFWQVAAWSATLEAEIGPGNAESLGQAGAALASAMDATGAAGSAAARDAAMPLPIGDRILTPAAAAPLAPTASPVALEAGHQSTGTSVAAVAGDMSVVAAVAGLAALLLGMPLYRRIVRGRVLHHALRERLLAEVRAEPGMHESEVARRLGISHTLAQYHLRVLTDFGLVEVKRYGGRKCLFAAGQVDRAGKAVLVAERGRAAVLVDLVGAQPGMQQRDLARALGVRESTVKWHLDRLVAEGVVVVERDAQGKRVRLAASAQRARLGAAAELRVAPAPAAAATCAAAAPQPGAAAPAAVPVHAAAPLASATEHRPAVA